MRAYCYYILLFIYALSVNSGFSQSIVNSGPSSVCGSSASGTLTVKNYTSVNRWEIGHLGPDGETFVLDQTVSSTQPTYSYNITSSKAFRAKLSAGQVYSQVATVSVFSPPIGGTLSSSATGCTSWSGTLTLSAHSGSIVKWQQMTQSGSWTDIANSTSAQRTFSNISVTTSFRVVIGSSFCGQAFSTVATITIGAPPGEPGTLSGTASYCNGGSGTVTLAGNTRPISRWQKSEDAGVAWSDIANTSSALSYNVTKTTLFRAVVSGTICTDVFSNTVTITINELAAGTLSGATTVCDPAILPSDPVSVLLTGYKGVIDRWERSLDGGPWNVVSYGNSPQYFIDGTTGSSRYRAKVTNSLCGSVYSNDVTIIVEPYIQGFLTGGATFCGSGAGTVSIQGYIGHDVSWQSSSDGISWNNLPNTGTSLSYSVSTTTYYRAHTTCNGYTNHEIITILTPPVPGTISGGGQRGCDYIEGRLTYSNDRTTVAAWQVAYNGSNTWNDIPGTFHAASYDYAFPIGVDIGEGITRFRVRVSSTNCFNVFSDPVSVTLDFTPVGPATTGAASNVFTASGLVSVSTSLVIEKWQKSDAAGIWTDIASTGTTYAYNNIVRTTSYRAIVKNGVCPGVGSVPATVKIFTLVGPNQMGEEDYATLELKGYDGSSVNRWEYSEDNGSTWITMDSQSKSIVHAMRQTTLFRVYFDAGSGPQYSNVKEVIMIPFSQWNMTNPVAGNNYTRAQTVLVDGVKDSSLVNSMPSASKHDIFIYQDGRGRILQEVVRQDMNDIVNFFDYDNAGRVAKAYLPYVASSNDGRYKDSYLQEQATFYSNGTTDKISDSNFPYSVTVFDGSPQSRVKEQGMPGQEWQPGNGHTIRSAYRLNVSGDAVRQFNVNGTSLGFYSPNTLTANEITDENGNKTLVFKDKLGNILLKKQQLDESIEGTMVSWLETYYIYDEHQRIKYIVPPKATVELQNNDWNFSGNFKDNFTHQFIYNERGQIIEKKVPGQAWIYYCYDNLARLVLTQDGNLRGNNQWLFTKYDKKGRPVLQGLYQDSSQLSRSSLQGVVALAYTTGNSAYPEHAWYENRDSVLHGYSNNSFPKLNSDNTPIEITSVNYYDNYDFDYNGMADFNYVPQGLPNESNSRVSPLNLATGSKKLMLGTTNWLYQYVFYDKDNRPIQVRSNNHLSLTIDNLQTTVYDFEGKPTTMRTVHNAAADLSVTLRYEYKEQRRLKRIYGNSSSPTPVQWGSLVGTSADANTIRKTTNTVAWDAGAFSTNSIPANADGTVEFRAGETTISKMLGFSDANVSNGFSDLDYAFFTAAGGILNIYEFGVRIGQFGTYTVNDVLSIERKSGTVYYKKNNSTVYTSTVQSNSALFVDCSLNGIDASFKNVNLTTPSEVLLVQYEHNALGQLVDKKLYSADNGATFKQSVDYRYSIRGWLESLNNASLTANSSNDDTDDYFGMEYLYQAIDPSLENTPYYNGNISVSRWKNAMVAAPTERRGEYSYTFDYDKINRLETARSKMFDGNTWSQELNAMNETVTYDHHGNILSLQRKQRKHEMSGITASYGAQTIDSLTYTYSAALADQVLKIKDKSTSTDGFKNGSTETTEYTYNPQGSLLTDLNKGISGVNYNFMGKPEMITFTDGRKILYEYDGTGIKLAMKVYQGSTLIKRTDYVNGFVYDNNKLSFYSSPEGRVIMNGTQQEYQFVLSDFQGNTRVLFTSATPEPLVVETDLELPANAEFQNYPAGAARNSWSLMNRTAGGTYSHLLNGGNNLRVGAAKSFKVYPGDKVKIQAFAKYYNPTSGNTNIAGFTSALLSAFSLSPPAAGETGTAASGVKYWGDIVSAGSGPGDTDYPKAFVNIVVFDKDYNFLDIAFDQIDGGAQTDTLTNVAHDEMMMEYLVKEAGYVFVYYSNESPTQVDVYFDDVSVIYTPTNILQYNEYYPFGMQTSTSWARDNANNNFLYNGGSELNAVSQVYDLPFRNYDAVIGRFMQIDPLASIDPSTSVYAYAGNNPVTLNDPSGLTYLNVTRGFNSIRDVMFDPSGDSGDGGGGSRSFGSGTWNSYGSPFTSGQAVMLEGDYEWLISRAELGDLSAVEQLGGHVLYANGMLNARSGVTGYMTAYRKSDGTLSAWDVTIDKINLNVSGDPPGSWLKRHFMVEMRADVSIGPQATFVYDGAIVPVPYSTATTSVNAKLMAYTLAGAKFKSGEGMSYTKPSDKNINQGFGVSHQGNSFEFNSEIINGKRENVLKIATLGGLFGVEWNVTNGQWIIGLMPGGAWTLGAGVSGSLKAGVVLK